MTLQANWRIRMWEWIKQLDRLLRGEATSIPELRRGGMDVPVIGLAVVIDALGMLYGLCMGLFAVTGSGSGMWLQIPASMIKVPALFLLTLLVTLPSLYVFNALVGSRLTFIATVRLLISALAIMLAVLASAGPIVAFFSVSTTSYSFMVLLNVLVFAISGVLGLMFLLQTLHRLSVAQQITEAAAMESAAAVPASAATSSENSLPPPLERIATAARATPSSSPLDRLERHPVGQHVRNVFRIWLVVFALVGAQMGWVLRPFIGAPGVPFTFLRPKESNFFEAVGSHALHLVSWGDMRDDARRGR